VNRTWRIAAREYLENVRTRAFLFGIVLTPLWFAVVFFVPRLLQEAEGEPKRVVVVDATGEIASDLARALGEKRTARGRPEYEVEVREAEGAWSPAGEGPSAVDALRSRAAEGDLLAVLLTPAVLEKRRGEDEGRRPAVVVANTVGGRVAGREVAAEVNRLVNERLMSARGIRREDAEILARDALPVLPLDRGGRPGSELLAVAPFAFMIFLFMGIVGISQILVNSTIEEKASRIYELLLSSVSPSQLMAGKILGICGVGFTLMLLWSGGGLLAAALQGIDGLVTGGQFGLFLAYYLLGFLLIASLMVAVGSACNTLKEAQNLMAPISLLLAMPLVLSIAVLKEPNGAFATVASFFPPFTPFMMMARIASVPGPPAWQIAASFVLLAVSVGVAIRLAGRVFRVGILMVGQPPRLREVWRWLRAG
jgi:ABC-2 type transport system permease protein